MTLSFDRVSVACAAAILLAGTADAAAEGWFSGDWYLTVGASGFVAPNYEGAKYMLMGASPLVSLGRAGTQARFTSRNDNISFALFDAGAVRAGPGGKIVWGRDGDDADELKGLDPVRWGAEAGVFAEVYPTDWLRVRGEVRHGLRSHTGVVADVHVDAFEDVTPTVRVSGGPRVSVASARFLDAYYGVSPRESAASGLSPFKSESGMRALGFGGAVTWRTTDKITTSLFGENARLMGSARDSSLVRERGSPNQLQIGISATYRFDFSM